MDTYSIYRSDTGKAVIAFNGEIQRLIAGAVVLAATKNGVTISQAGQEVFKLRIAATVAIRIGDAVFTGTTGSELLEALDPFFFEGLEFHLTAPAGTPVKLIKVPLENGQTVSVELSGWFNSASYFGSRIYYTAAYKRQNGALSNSTPATIFSGNAPLIGGPFAVISNELYIYAPTTATEAVTWSLTIKLQY